MIRPSRMIIISMTTTMLIGCVTPPHHTGSDTLIPHATRNGLKIIPNAMDYSQMHWWTRLHDPVLNKLIQDALSNNMKIKEATAHQAQAQASLRAAQFAWLPTLGASGTGFIGSGWGQQFTPQGPLTSSIPWSKIGNLNFRGYDSGFVPSYSLNIMQNIHNNHAAEASLAIQKAMLLSTRLSIISQMSGAYFMLLGNVAQKKLQMQLIHDLQTIRALEWIRFQDGASDLTTVTSIDQQIATNQANLLSIQDSISNIENAMQVLLNHNPGPIKTHRPLSGLSITRLVPENIPSAVLQHRPDVIIAQEQLNVSKANVGIAMAQFFPTISLTGLLGAASVDLTHLLKLSTNLWIAEAAASVPLLNGSAYAQIKAANASYSATYYAYVYTLKSVFSDVDNALTHQQAMNAIYSRQLKALMMSQQARNLAFERYTAGATDERALAYANRDLDNAKLALNLAKMQQLDSLVAVYQALAGGYC